MILRFGGVESGKGQGVRVGGGSEIKYEHLSQACGDGRDENSQGPFTHPILESNAIYFAQIRLFLLLKFKLKFFGLKLLTTFQVQTQCKRPSKEFKIFKT